MKIGEFLTYNGRGYVLLGMEPMSVPDRRCELRDVETGERLCVPYALVAQTGEGLNDQP
jgi:hypothetical protein